MSYRVCIPTAGLGSRLERNTNNLNKSLVSIANKPIICYILEQFPADCEFVIALGYKGNLVKEFLEIAYPDKSFIFSYVDIYEGPQSGLSRTLLSCKEELSEPFTFISCDTLVENLIDPPFTNWMGYATTELLAPYRTIALHSDAVIEILEKGEGFSANHKAYIGLAGIFDFDLFWEAMNEVGCNSYSIGESFGLRALIKNGISGKEFVWHDTGNLQSLEKTRSIYAKPNQPNILEKSNEAIWFVDNIVIKYSDNTEFISNRVKRSKILANYVPKIIKSSNHIYSYERVDGSVLSSIISLSTFKKLLSFCQSFWEVYPLHKEAQSTFRASCNNFYHDKTLSRVNNFYNIFGREDCLTSINCKDVPLLSMLVTKIDWDWLSNGLPGRFHGDFHFENILLCNKSNQFVLLDWRQEFGGSLEIGDIYYDLAKLLHGLIMNHQIIAQDLYSVDWQGTTAIFDFHRKLSLIECEDHFLIWAKYQGYDIKRIKILTSLIFLNISSLHHYPYSDLLYCLGVLRLSDALS